MTPWGVCYNIDPFLNYCESCYGNMIDGTIARKTNSTSTFGSQLDTIADFIFVMLSLFKLLSTIHIPLWLWIWGILIAIIKILNITWGYISKKQLISLHTTMNKITGLLLFLLPLTLSFIVFKYSSFVDISKTA